MSSISKLDILLPTLGRSDKLAVVAENIKSTTTTPYTLYFICESSDAKSCEAAEKNGTLLKGGFGSPAKAVNFAFIKSDSPYFIFANDDFLFHKDWDKKALAKMTNGVSVVALNDGNPQEPQWGTITLSRRSYITNVGGTENKGEVFHEGYGHAFPDTEFWERAKSRGVTAIAEDSLVEHLHKAFGKGEEDALHHRQLAHFPADQALYKERSQQWP